MRAVKNFRKGEAHPTLNLKEVEDAIKVKELTNRQMKSHCEELLKLYKRLKTQQLFQYNVLNFVEFRKSAVY